MWVWVKSNRMRPRGAALKGSGLLPFVLGLIASNGLPAALGLQSFISPDLTAWGLGRAALIGVAIGVLGAVYPVWRVRRMYAAAALAPA